MTRRRILDAGKSEFISKGYHGATIAAIARRAEVAPQTVYFVFHNKPELISAVIDDAVLGTDATPPEASAWWAEMRSAATAADALTAFVRGAAPLLERAAFVSVVLKAAALADPEVQAIQDKHDRMQEAGYRQVIDTVAAKGPLRADLTPATATDALLMLCGDSTYVQLRHDRQWTHDQIVAFLDRIVVDSILQDQSH
ncbi:TetR/AcrR family transcriptional regulator [Microbacterium sp. NPDC057407]|uniref:TetR/AcrR family transcriptional regulator n=1 Tax=unclassified Microbacterium TaxID=2609290 RepID=UPI0035D8ABA9